MSQIMEKIIDIAISGNYVELEKFIGSTSILDHDARSLLRQFVLYPYFPVSIVKKLVYVPDKRIYDWEPVDIITIDSLIAVTWTTNYDLAKFLFESAPTELVYNPSIYMQMGLISHQSRGRMITTILESVTDADYFFKKTIIFLIDNLGFRVRAHERFEPCGIDLDDECTITPFIFHLAQDFVNIAPQRFINTAFLLATFLANLGTMECALRRGANVDGYNVIDDMDIPLILAIDHQHEKVIDLLLRNGATCKELWVFESSDDFVINWRELKISCCQVLIPAFTKLPWWHLKSIKLAYEKLPFESFVKYYLKALPYLNFLNLMHKALRLGNAWDARLYAPKTGIRWKRQTMELFGESEIINLSK